MGFAASLVSNGAERASFANQETAISALPPQIEVKRFTGAGDTLAAHFLWAQTLGQKPKSALESALIETSEFISSEERDA